MLLFYFRTEYNKLDTKKGRAADVDTWVCQYSKRKLGGFHCPKMMRVKRYRDQHGLSGLIDVERNDQPHDHSQEQEEEDRVYQIYDKGIDALLTECIKDGLTFRATISKLAAKYLDWNFEDLQNRRNLYQKRHR